MLHTRLYSGIYARSRFPERIESSLLDNLPSRNRQYGCARFNIDEFVARRNVPNASLRRQVLAAPSAVSAYSAFSISVRQKY